MKHLGYYISCLLILFLASCQEDNILAPERELKPNEYEFTISIPEAVASTRIMGDKPSKETLQNMHILVFDGNGLFMAKRRAEVNFNSNLATTGTLKVELSPADDTRILHFIAGNVNLRDDYSRGDSESKIFSELKTTNKEDAYWQRVTVSQIMNQEQVKEELPNPIQLIRNFAKISLEKDPLLNRLVIEGFAVINDNNEGSVAPYKADATGGFADFITDLSSQQDIYTAFTNLNKGYEGFTLGTPVITENPIFDTETKYVYEKRQNGVQTPAYLLLKAQYDNTPCYYKIDIVKTDSKTHITSYLNLYRNFHYKIKITNVVGKGYDNMKDAMNAAASNNISASVEVSQVNKITDGENVLEVSTIDEILVNSKPFQLTYKYLKKGQLSNQDVVVTPIANTNDGINHLAVTSISNDHNGTVTITPINPLPDFMETQELILATPSGLSRKVTIRIRKPFRFEIVDCQRRVKAEVNATLGIGVRLPANMPRAVFPLTLDFESEKKSIYPNAEMNIIPVTSGNHSFKYKTKITYADYRQSRAFYFHFKTNTAESATKIKVSNPYFMDENNVCEFSNTEGVIYKFTDVQFGVEGAMQDMTTNKLYSQIPYKEGTIITLQFKLENPDHKYMIGIYPGENLEYVESSTGSATIHQEVGGIAYLPNPDTANEVQILKFKTTKDLVGSMFEIYSNDYEMFNFTYRNGPIILKFKYQYTVNEGSLFSPNYMTYTKNILKGETVSVYRNPEYSGRPTSTLTMTRDGECDLNAFAGSDYEEEIFFKYTIKINRVTYDCRGSISVREIVNSGNGGNTVTLVAQ